MNELFTKGVIIITAVLLLISGGLGWFVNGALEKKKQVKQQVTNKVAEMERVLAKKESARKEENIRLKSLIGVLSHRQKEIVSLAIPYREKLPVFAPLEFKEDLLKVEMNLKEEADFAIPEGIGFKEYIGGTIPKESEIAELTKQLYIIKEIISLLINVKSGKIEEIQRGSKIEENELYKSYLFKLKFLMITDNLIKFLVDLQNSKRFIVVHDIVINATSDQQLQVEMNLKVIDFKE